MEYNPRCSFSSNLDFASFDNDNDNVSMIPNAPQILSTEEQGNSFTQADLDEINDLEEKEIGKILKRRWDSREHSLFLEARKLFQDLSPAEKWSKISQHIQSRLPEEVELHSNIYEFQFCNPARAVFASNSITDFYDFTTSNWTLGEQEIINKEYARIENEAQEGENLLHTYFSIAAKLPNKSVRDVAFRMRWMREKHLETKKEASTRLRGEKAKTQASLAFPGNERGITNKNTQKNLTKDITSEEPPREQEKHKQTTEKEIYANIKHQLDENERILRTINHNLIERKVKENITLMEKFRQNCTEIPNLLRSLNEQNIQCGWAQMPTFPVELKTFPVSSKSRSLLPPSLLDENPFL